MDQVEPIPDTGAGPRHTVSRRAMMALGAGATVVGASALVPGTAAAETTSTGNHHGFETRIKVAPGVHVNVADLNGGNKGTIVLIPGWPLSSTMMENTTLFLADRGYRAVAIDLRGFGKSDAPYAPYSYDVWCADIRTVLRAMSLRNVTLVGHSMGGAVALRYAARFRSRVSKLVVAEPAAPRFVYGPKSADLAAGLAGLIEGYAEDRSPGRTRADEDVLLHPHRRHHRPVPAVLRTPRSGRGLTGGQPGRADRPARHRPHL